MIDLEEKYIEFVKNIISRYLKEYKLYLFGSRVKGTARKFSDIDLAIQSKYMTRQIKDKLQVEFENSTLPYEVDIVDLNNILDDFKMLIKDSMVEI